MGLQEIILHTLFESGVSEVQDLERYIADDVERYGTRLADNESKLVRVYRDRVSVPLQCLGVLLTWVSRSPPPTASSSTRASSTRTKTTKIPCLKYGCGYTVCSHCSLKLSLKH